MKDPSTFNFAATLLLIVAVIVSNVAQLEALTVAETCKIVGNGSFIGDPADCQGWVYCLNGEPIYGKCGNGYLYDSASGACDYPDRVVCSSNVTTMCTGLTNVYKADPFDCSNYCYCNNGVSYCQSCPTNQYYDPGTVSCKWSNNSPCQPSSPCLLVKNGFVKDSTSCSKWIRCANGAAAGSGDCTTTAGEYYYNPNTQACDYKENVACTLTPGSSPSETPVPPIDGCGTTTENGNFISDEVSCTGYFFCSAAGPTPQWGQCPPGSNFNVDTQQCNDPYLVDCEHNRCEGVSKTFMTAPGTFCKSYYVCNNGVKGKPQACPTEYPNFNEEAQACQSDPVTYPICGTATAGSV